MKEDVGKRLKECRLRFETVSARRGKTYGNCTAHLSAFWKRHIWMQLWTACEACRYFWCLNRLSAWKKRFLILHTSCVYFFWYALSRGDIIKCCNFDEECTFRMFDSSNRCAWFFALLRMARGKTGKRILIGLIEYVERNSRIKCAADMLFWTIIYMDKQIQCLYLDVVFADFQDIVCRYAEICTQLGQRGKRRLRPSR